MISSAWSQVLRLDEMGPVTDRRTVYGGTLLVQGLSAQEELTLFLPNLYQNVRAFDDVAGQPDFECGRRENAQLGGCCSGQ